ncbi:hypothetical protein [Streptomyces sp. NPDC048650]|uniref:hypothetical protein n=1 Tax=unclassified Streptomyces TaxID=2593676 RepID=UPI0037194725
MPMPHMHPRSPAPDATVVRTGRRGAMTGLPICLALIALGLIGVVGLVMLATGTAKQEFSVKGLFALLMMLVFGALGVLFGIPVWRARRAAILVDRAGVWLDNGTARQIVPWDVLAGVGVQWSRLGRRGKQLSIEMCPSGPIDDRDPVLWALVRDEDPIAPGLPRLRYRLPVPPGSQARVTAAVRQYAPPQLWLGEAQREPGHIGRPDLSRRPGR